MPRPKSTPHEFAVANIFDDSISDALLAHEVMATLTPREIDVFVRVSRGALTKNIAVDLNISRRTVDVLRYRIKRKLKLRSLAEEAVLGYRTRHAMAEWALTRAFQLRCFGDQRVGKSQLTRA